MDDDDRFLIGDTDAWVPSFLLIITVAIIWYTFR